MTSLFSQDRQLTTRKHIFRLNYKSVGRLQKTILNGNTHDNCFAN